MRIKVEDVKNEDKEFKKEGVRTGADILFDPIQSITLEYLGDYQSHQHKKNENVYKYLKELTLFGNVTALYATKIAHNLLWHIDIDSTLKFAKQNPSSLLVKVEVKDPHGQRVRGTPLQILAAAGDFNPRKLKLTEKDYGLVERLRPCFPNKSEYDKQLEDWFQSDFNYETNRTISPYIRAIKTFCSEIIESKEITDDIPFTTLLKIPIAEKFRKSLIPDPNHVVTTGLLFDLRIFFDFFEIWQENAYKRWDGNKYRPHLGGWNSLKGILFGAIVYSALQVRMQRIDLEIFKKGIQKVYDNEMPKHMDLSDSNGGLTSKGGLTVNFFYLADGKVRYASSRELCEKLYHTTRIVPCLSQLISSKFIHTGIRRSYIPHWHHNHAIEYQ